MARIDSYNPEPHHFGDNRYSPVKIAAPDHPMLLRSEENRKAETQHPMYRKQRLLDRARQQLRRLGGKR